MPLERAFLYTVASLPLLSLGLDILGICLAQSEFSAMGQTAAFVPLVPAFPQKHLNQQFSFCIQR